MADHAREVRATQRNQLTRVLSAAASTISLQSRLSGACRCVECSRAKCGECASADQAHRRRAAFTHILLNLQRDTDHRCQSRIQQCAKQHTRSDVRVRPAMRGERRGGITISSRGRCTRLQGTRPTSAPPARRRARRCRAAPCPRAARARRRRPSRRRSPCPPCPTWPPPSPSRRRR